MRASKQKKKNVSYKVFEKLKITMLKKQCNKEAGTE